MKQAYHIYLFLFIVNCMFSCKKEALEIRPLASVQIFNGVVGSSGIKSSVHFLSTTIAYGAASISTKAVTGGVLLYVYPIGDSLHPYYNRIFNFAGGDTYSLFLSGTLTAQDTLFVKDKIAYLTDSTFSIRFVNLVSNAGPLNVVLSTAGNSVEFSNVGYRQVTEFKNYAARATNTAYTFQIKDALSGVVYASLALTSTTIPRFKSITLALRGSIGGTGTAAPTITRINHY